MNEIYNPACWRKCLQAAALGLVLLSTSCTKNFDKTNTKKDAVATVGSAEIPFLFSKALSAAPNSEVPYQTAQNLFADQYAQYFACNVTYFASDRYVIQMSWIVDAFKPMYTVVMPQLQTIMTKAAPNSPQYALADIWWVYTFHRLTDQWGPIPYFSAGIPGNSVPYDAQDKIYDDFFKRLDTAVNILKANADGNAYGSFDIIYGGSIAKWIKYANSLRLRLAMRISKVDPARAKTEAETAFAGGVMTSSDDDAFVKRYNYGYDGNGLSSMSDYGEFRMSATMESILKGYNDPRMPEYFLPAVTSGTYEGLRNGLSTDELQDPENTADENSHVGARWTMPTAGGLPEYMSTPQSVMTAAEVYFLRAEGALLGWNMGGSAKEMYETGIATSMNQWRIKDTAAISAYMNGSALPVAPNDYLNSPAVANVPVKFSSVPGEQLEQIAIQKWLAIFPDGVEAWADLRRSREFKLYPVAHSDNSDIPDPTTEWIRRIPFLDQEKLVNGAEVEKAVQLLNGPDKVSTPLWWDKN